MKENPRTFLNFEAFLGMRYMMSKKDNKFISLITVISILAVAIGVTALVTVLSVMAGFESELKQKMLGSHAPIILQKFSGEGITEQEEVMKTLEKIDGITAATPVIFKEGMLISDYRKTSGVFVNGVDLDRAPKVSKICRKLDEEGVFAQLRQETTAASPFPPIIVSRGISRNLIVGVGDVVSLISPFGEITPFGNQPKVMKFMVVGIFDSGLYEFEAEFLYMSLATAQNFFSFGHSVNRIDVAISDLNLTDRISSDISMSVGSPFYVSTWKNYSGSLLSALKLEKTVMFLILTMIVLVAAFNIVAMLIMIVMEKGRDIAILKSMGASDFSILKIFVTIGMSIGSLGTALGLATGLALSFLLKEYIRFPLNPQVYYIETLPVEINGVDFTAVGVAALIICFLATIYPSWKASQLKPVDGLRYE